MVDTGPGRILIVEDQEPAREVFRVTLQPEGHLLTFAESGDEALSLAGASDKPDVILLDLNLPTSNMDGYEICRQLRKNEQTDYIPVIIVTATGLDHDNMLIALEAGANDYLKKPLERTNLRLRVRNAIQTKRLYDELRESYRRLQKSEMEKSDLRTRIVHDLKTPLVIIQGYMDLVLSSGNILDESMIQEAITVTSSQAEGLLADIDDILKPLDDDWKPAYEEFDLALLTGRVITAEKMTQRSAHHEFETLGIDQPCLIKADRRKVRRVLENLLSNAVKYSPGHGKRIQIKLTKHTKDVSVSFEDEGIGLTSEQLKKVLEGGGRVVDPQLGIEGTGFGVDSCLRVLHMHHGKLTGSSTYGSGSTFTITIPCNGST